MNITTLSIGDELLYGEVVDTNASCLGGRLYAAGLKVQRHLTVGDNEPDIMEAIEALAGKSDAVIVTGGLGPTVDDITARAVAKLTGRRLILNNEALSHLHRYYAKQGGEMHPSNEKQALLPAKSTLIPNPLGTACGFALIHKGCFFFFLPGVPCEMKRMFDDTVIRFLMEHKKNNEVVMTKVLKVFGLAEVDAGALLHAVIPPDSGITTAFCVNFPEVHVKFRAEGDQPQEAADRLAITSEMAKRKLR